MAHEIQGNVFVKADPNEEEVVIPDGITEIASKAFYCCRAKKFVVPESVTSLSEKSFDASGMTSIIVFSSGSIHPATDSQFIAGSRFSVHRGAGFCCP